MAAIDIRLLSPLLQQTEMTARLASYRIISTSGRIICYDCRLFTTILYFFVLQVVILNFH